MSRRSYDLCVKLSLEIAEGMKYMDNQFIEWLYEPTSRSVLGVNAHECRPFPMCQMSDLENCGVDWQSYHWTCVSHLQATDETHCHRASQPGARETRPKDEVMPPSEDTGTEDTRTRYYASAPVPLLVCLHEWRAFAKEDSGIPCYRGEPFH